jgi:predicted RND superfamily exporter protein
VTALQVLFRANDELEELHDRITSLEAEALDGSLTEEQLAELELLETRAAPLEKQLTETRNREIDRIREIVAEYQGEADVYLGGVHVLGHQLIEIVRSDLVVFGSAIAVLVAVLLLVLFRELRWIVIAFSACLVSIGSTIGLFGLLGLEATVISANFIALQLILTLAMVVHLIVQYREYARTHGDWDPGRLVRETMAAKTPPILYAGATTAIGFAALLASGLQPVISFGWMMIIAVAISMATVLTLFPAMLTILDRRTETNEARSIRRSLAALAEAVLARGGVTLSLAAVFLAVCVAGFFRLNVENSFINYFDDDTEVHRELTFIDRHLGGSTPLDIVYAVPPAEGDLVMEAETFQDIQKLQVLFGRHEAVGKIMSPDNFTALARQVNDGRPLTEYEVTAAYRLMDEDLRESLLGAYFAPETNEVRFNLRIQDATEGLDRSDLLRSLRDDVETVLGEDADYQMANLFVLYEDILQQLFRSQVLTLGIVYVAIMIAFLLIFRSLRIALVAMVPNVLVTATVFGIMGWFGIALDLMTITIAAVAMGIAVDDTIHYIHRFQLESRSSDAASAVRRTHTTVGFAVLYTTIIIVAGFASLVFSDFVPSILFGLLTGVALGGAFLFDMTVLPVLLARFTDRQAG